MFVTPCPQKLTSVHASQFAYRVHGTQNNNFDIQMKCLHYQLQVIQYSKPVAWSFIEWKFLKGTVKWNKSTREALAEILSEPSQNLQNSQIFAICDSCCSSRSVPSCLPWSEAQLVPLPFFRYIHKQQCHGTTAVANVSMMRYAFPRAWKLQMHHTRCARSNWKGK